MSRSSVSPGAALLRSSRMFSLPKPLPEPVGRLQYIADRRSDTMTRPSPQMQSIASPLTSRQNGDWGLKRPFPLRTTLRSSMPYIRVKNIDAMENVTDFSSASDFTMTLEKFQELHIPMTLPKRRFQVREIPRTTSVFEETMDVTDTQDEAAQDYNRWKFEGPNLSKMSEIDFVKYLKTKVRPQREAFYSLLKQHLAEDINTRRKTEAMEHGKPTPPPVTTADITDAQFTEYMRALRNDLSLLYDIVARFLDLPPIYSSSFMQQISPPSGNNDNPWSATGLPPSHPSAGLGYLRTSSFLENHPVYGPQARRMPTIIRVLYPRTMLKGAMLGVAGFVADVPPGESAFNSRDFSRRHARGSRSVVPGVTCLDMMTYGGAKAYAEPVSARVNASGKIVLEIRDAGDEARIIAGESSGKRSVYNNRPMNRQPIGPESQSPTQLQAQSQVSNMSPSKQLADALRAPKGSRNDDYW